MPHQPATNFESVQRYNVPLPIKFTTSEVICNGVARYDFHAEIEPMRYTVESSGGNGMYDTRSAARIAGRKAVTKWARTMREMGLTS